MLERNGTIFVFARVGTNLGLPTEVPYDLEVAPESGILERSRTIFLVRHELQDTNNM